MLRYSPTTQYISPTVQVASPARTRTVPIPTPRVPTVPIPTPRTPTVPIPTPRAPTIPIPTPRAPTISIPTPRTIPVPTPRTIPIPAARTIPTPAARTIPIPAARTPTIRVPTIPIPATRTPTIPIPATRTPTIRTPTIRTPTIRTPTIRRPIIPTNYPAYAGAPVPTVFGHLPYEVLVELLLDSDPKDIASLCATSRQIRAICQDENFLFQFIRRHYPVSMDKIPGRTIKDKYDFISIFDRRYFTDPDFVRPSPHYIHDFGTNYTSRTNPDDALNTILSIWQDSETAELATMIGFKPLVRRSATTYRVGYYNLNFVNLLSGAIMTKSELFANSIIDIIVRRIFVPGQNIHVYRNHYAVSFRYPFILAVEYGMPQTISLLRQHYDPDMDLYLREEILHELTHVDSEEVFNRFLPYLSTDNYVYWTLVRNNNYKLADYALSILDREGRNPYRYDPGRARLMSDFAIQTRDAERIRYLMKYLTPTQADIDEATRLGYLELIPVLQGQ